MAKTVEIRAHIQGEPTVTSPTKTSIEGHFNKLSIKQVNKFWNNKVSNKERISIDVDGNYICVLEDWVCMVYGKTYINCIIAFCALHNFLVNHLNKRLTFEVVEPVGRSGTIDDLIRAKVRKGRLITAGITIGLLIAGGVASWIIELAYDFFKNRF